MNPAFQVTHSFSLASQTNPSQYNFGAVFASNKVALLVDQYLIHLLRLFLQVFMQGSVDHEGNITSRFNYGWTPANVTKMQAQVSHLLVYLEDELK